MATWITHMIIADEVLELFPQLDKRGFCVGNIAPDCNEPNEDRTDFIPPRKVTHWMTDEKKPSDTDIFYREYFAKHSEDNDSKEYYSFLLGYYSHLITDADFQWFIREPGRVRAAWDRVKADERYKTKIDTQEETWDTFKRVVTSKEIQRERDALEAEYLRNYPDYECSYFTEILPLKDFPDYVDYLPRRGIVRNIQNGSLFLLDSQVTEQGLLGETLFFYSLIQVAVRLHFAEPFPAFNYEESSQLPGAHSLVLGMFLQMRCKKFLQNIQFHGHSFGIRFF